MRPITEKEFWARAERHGECLIWKGNVGDDGYGKLSVRGKTVRAHRMAWTLSNGPIPRGKGVLHRCDVRLCIEPTHLFLGVPADNSADMVRKGRSFHPHGEAHGGAKLTVKDVLAIRAARPRTTLAKLGKRYGIGTMQVSRIARGKRWSCVPM